MDINQNKESKIEKQEQIIFQQQLKNVDELVIKILTYRNKTNGRLYDSLNQEYLFNLLEKNKIIEIEKSFPQKGVDIIDFVRIFLNNIPHREDETLYLTISLVDLFKRISESLNLQTTIKMKDVTSVICDVIKIMFIKCKQQKIIQSKLKQYFVLIRMQEKNSVQNKIQSVQMPEPQYFKLDSTKIRSIDIEPPPIYGKCNDDLQRLVKQKIKTDSVHHLNHRIKTQYHIYIK